MVKTAACMLKQENHDGLILLPRGPRLYVAKNTDPKYFQTMLTINKESVSMFPDKSILKSLLLLVGLSTDQNNFLPLLNDALGAIWLKLTQQFMIKGHLLILTLIYFQALGWFSTHAKY